jgi:hypothetical protein
MSLQRTLEAGGHVEEEQFLVKEQTFNIEKSLIYRAGTRKRTVPKTEGHNLEPR